MALQHVNLRSGSLEPPKSVVEHAACFGVALIVLSGLALGIQWIFNILAP